MSRVIKHWKVDTAKNGSFEAQLEFSFSHGVNLLTSSTCPAGYCLLVAPVEGGIVSSPGAVRGFYVGGVNFEDKEAIALAEAMIDGAIAQVVADRVIHAAN